MNIENIVETIHTHLEALKYLSDTAKKPPTGEGISMDIVMLPDLVFDIRSYAIDDISKNVCAIGGRASRTACILGHLIDDDDGIYRPHLIVKTGNLGKLLLKNEFSRTDKNDFALKEPNEKKVLHKYIVERPGESRCTIWNKPDGDFQWRDAANEEELSSDDMRNSYIINRKFENARTIYFSSMRTPNFESLFRWIIKKVTTQSNKSLFFDLTRAAKNHILLFDGRVGQLSIDYRTEMFGGVFFPGTDTEFKNNCLSELGCDNVEDLSMKWNVPIIYYDNDIVEYFDQDGNKNYTIANHDIHFENEDVPERFKAGIILAYSLYKAIDQLNDNDNLCKTLKSHWSQTADIYEKIIQYGIALGRTEEVKDPEELFKALPFPDKSEHLNRSHKSAPRKMNIKYTDEIPKRIQLKDTDLPLLANLAKLRRSNEIAEELTHERCIIAEKNWCKFNDDEKADNPKLALLIDLDGTLLNASEQRENALKETLAFLDRRVSGSVLEDSYEFFNDYIYECWPLYKEIGLGDFRQQWNIPGWYGIYILLRENVNLRREINAAKDKIKQRETEEILKNIGAEEVKSLYDAVCTRYKDQINLSIQYFWSVEMHAFKEARDFLSTLKQSGMFKLYIVSEGEPETQRAKLKSTNLSEFFESDCILTTGDAAEPESERILLDKEVNFIDKKLSLYETQKNTVDSNQKVLNNIETEISNNFIAICRKAHMSNPDNIPSEIMDCFSLHKNQQRYQWIEQVEYIEVYKKRKKVSEFVTLVLDRLALKEGIVFYSNAIRAILREPEKPLTVLRQFENLFNDFRPKSPMKFVMLGDRQKNDIAPPKNILGNKFLLSIRIVTDKYSIKEPIDKKWYYPPTFIVDNLAQAKLILLDENNYKNIGCIIDPPLFCWNIDLHNLDYFPQWDELFQKKNESDKINYPTIGLNHILYGIMMSKFDFKLINRICRGVLKEFLHQNPATDLTPIIEMACCKSHQVKNMTTSEMWRRSRILTSLILDNGITKSNISLRKNFESKIETILRSLEIYKNRFENVENKPPELNEIDETLNQYYEKSRR